MFFLERKLDARIKEIEGFRYRDMVDIPTFSTIVDNGDVAVSPPKIGDSHDTISIGDRWQGRDVYRWLQTKFKLPFESDGLKVVGRFKFGRTNEGTNYGFESLLFVDGKPYQGVDSNHDEVLFDTSLSGQEVSIDFRMWTGLEGGGPQEIQSYALEMAEIGLLDERVDGLYYTMLAMYQVVVVLDDRDPVCSQLLALMDRTFLKIDWTNAGSDAFYASCYEAQAFIRAEIAKFDKDHPVTIHCVGHTHIDVAWLWRLKHTREKCARSFSTAVHLMEQYPDYLFIQSQPQLYEYIKEDYPEIYGKIKERVRAGQWEAEGSMWLEADCNVSSGESLVRQILTGKRFLKEEFGVDNKILWLPDVFGYSWALPQILRKSGIESFMTTKISWNEYNRIPNDTFYWKGIDGTKILTHFITTPDKSPEIPYYTYNGHVKAESVIHSWSVYRDKKVNQDLLLSYGYGDGGGGVNREMLELRRHLDEIPGIPNVKPTTAGKFFDKLHETIENTDQYVHEWNGELYLEYHRGTYTSQAFVKRHNRKLELALREWEFMNVLNSMENGWGRYQSNAIQDAWKVVLRNQFHDIIPGSSIREVYEDAEIEYNGAWDLYNKGLYELGYVNDVVDNKYTLFNMSSLNGKQLVFIPFDSENNTEGVFKDLKGTILTSQKSENGWFVFVEGAKQFAGSEINFEKAEISTKSNAFIIGENALKTPFYDVEWNEKGQITKLFDKEADRNVLRAGSEGNVLQIFEDKPIEYDAWNIDLFYQEKMKEIDDLISAEVIENGALRAVVQLKWKFNKSVIAQDMIFYSKSRRIDFVTNADWHEKQLLLKAAFPVEVRTTEATYDVQFGNVKRPTHWNTSWDMAKFESVGHQWADLSETGYGVSLMNDCKYGYDIKDGVMRLSLIKSAIFPDPEADQGEHTFTYSLFPHIGDWREAGTQCEAWELNSPIKVVNGSVSGENKSLVNTTNTHVFIDAVKKCEDKNGVIIRLHEFEGRRGKVELFSDYEIKNWYETNLMEEPLDLNKNTEAIELKVTPYEIKTIYVEFE